MGRRITWPKVPVKIQLEESLVNARQLLEVIDGSKVCLRRRM